MSPQAVESAGPGIASPPPDSNATLSKNAQKKAAKAARFAAQKHERRAREREAKKEKKRKLREAEKEDGEDDGTHDRRKRARLNDPLRGSMIKFPARLVVDLGFDDKMSDKEIISLTSQLAYTYSANRKAVRPFEHLLFTSLNGKTFARLESLGDAGYKRWAGTEWWSDSYERLWKGEDNISDSLVIQRPTVVYLTADSSDELTELKEGETYIIGGICDHNRYKNLCQDKAISTGIRSARLPIGTYLAQLPTRKVLTVNQVVEILLKWTETRDWGASLHSVVPKRKFHRGKRKDGGTAEEQGNEMLVAVDEELEL